MLIRVMNETDYESAYALWTETPGMGMRALDDSAEGIAKFLRRNPTTCFIAEENGSLAGVILCGHDGRRGYIYHTAVSEAFRRRGVGTSLANAAMEALRAEGIRKCALVAYRSNELGNAFWERMGFTLRPDLHYRNMALSDGEQLISSVSTASDRPQ